MTDFLESLKAPISLVEEEHSVADSLASIDIDFALPNATES